MDILKMSKIEKSIKVLKKHRRFSLCDHNAHKNNFGWKKLLWYFFSSFSKKELKNILFWKYMETFGNDFTPKNPEFFTCDYCHFTASNKIDYKKHTETINHKTNKWKRLEIIGNAFYPKKPQICFRVWKMYTSIILAYDKLTKTIKFFK